MIVDATIDFDALKAALERIGATITWAAEERTIRTLTIEADVDDDEACEALPASYFSRDEDQHAEIDDPRIVHDFVAACALGDRLVAEALVPRLFGSPGNQFAAERGPLDAHARLA